ncbi:hypothetical protein MPTK1_3g23190 [Marchantia polymorpha subsp. ruderalis]|uniref:Uncharacterized protein n=2 Tax=Marchantia polymorpha TaxID=3197 RepID=A0AAF6B3V7_MARPO|nr:hypothetical protein MARPO_0024s0096 [Marchantia polymorpha]BBN06691.1 hypothetical protein Mp_3g23190 [Marchantia polymorpha subsp. ruderalis]|eukprot:PTQ43591.1 hypothetical protein MARPO_0024s0096 [Marchantia polymorpha]
MIGQNFSSILPACFYFLNQQLPSSFPGMYVLSSFFPTGSTNSNTPAAHLRAHSLVVVLPRVVMSAPLFLFVSRTQSCATIDRLAPAIADSLPHEALDKKPLRSLVPKTR